MIEQSDYGVVGTPDSLYADFEITTRAVTPECIPGFIAVIERQKRECIEEYERRNGETIACVGIELSGDFFTKGGEGRLVFKKERHEAERPT